MGKNGERGRNGNRGEGNGERKMRNREWGIMGMGENVRIKETMEIK